MRYLLLVLLFQLSVRAEPDPELLKDKKNVSIIFGAAICLDQKMRADALAEIAKEKKYSKVGGIVDKHKLYELQKRVRWADEHEADDRKNLKTFPGVKAAPCSNVLVKEVIACRLSDDQDSCPSPQRELSYHVPAYNPDEE